MSRTSCIGAIFTVLLCCHLGYSKEFLRMCYFTSWSNTRPSSYAKFDIADIDTSLCTHLIYAFGKIDKESKSLVAAVPNEEEDRPGYIGRYRQFTNLKSKGPQTLLSLGGQNDDASGFLSVTETPEILDFFVSQSIGFLTDHGFDGLDIDWEYPNKETRTAFITLLKALRRGFDRQPAGQKLLLTVAGAAGEYWLEQGYDIPAIARHVDYVNLMTYDYHTKENKVAGFNAPLYSRKTVTFNPTLSMNWTVHYWRERGLPFSQMVVGMTSVGRQYRLQNINNTEPGAAVTQETIKGDYYGMEDRLAYSEICTMLDSIFTVRTFDAEQQVPYLVKGDNWVGYDDEQSINVKIPWMLELGTAGFMYWSLDLDDFTGKKCYSGNYPFLTTMNKALRKDEGPTLTNNVNKDINYLSKNNGNQGESLNKSSVYVQVLVGVICALVVTFRAVTFH